MRFTMLLAMALPLIAALPLNEAEPVQDNERSSILAEGELSGTIRNVRIDVGDGDEIACEAGEEGGPKIGVEPPTSFPPPKESPTSVTPKESPTSSTAKLPPPSSTPKSTPKSAPPPLTPPPSTSKAPPAPPNDSNADGVGSTPGDVPANAKQGLAKVNELRARHSAPALTWDKGLEKMAQDWVNSCQSKHGGTVEETGQNIFASTAQLGPDEDYLSKPTQVWYSEEPAYAKATQYKEASSEQLKGLRHFTQLVWKATTKMGCARNTVACPEGTIVVCNYQKAGNLNGAYNANVSPPSA